MIEKKMLIDDKEFNDHDFLNLIRTGLFGYEPIQHNDKKMKDAPPTHQPVSTRTTSRLS